MVRVGLQPHTLHQLEEPTVDTLERAAVAGYQGVELGVDDHDEEVLAALEERDLAVSSVGISREALETGAFEDHVAASESFGTDDVVLMWLDEEHFASREAAERTAHRLDEWADAAAERGLTLHYHNHAHEFVDFGDHFAYEVTVRAADRVRFELDLGWAGTGGVHPVGLLYRVQDAVTHVHVKDMDFEAGEFVTFGEGDLEVGSVVDALETAGVEWALFENDRPVDPVAEPAHASLVLDQYTDHVCR